MRVVGRLAAKRWKRAITGVPVPEKFAADAQQVEDAIKRALHEADQRSIAGNEVTPFILQRVAQLTGGASLKANIALIKHNAAVGARIAAALYTKPVELG